MNFLQEKRKELLIHRVWDWILVSKFLKALSGFLGEQAPFVFE